MPTVTVKRHSPGLDLSASPFEIPNGAYTRLDNLNPSTESLELRPGRIRYLTQISPNLPATGLARYYRSGIGGGSGPRFSATQVDDAGVGTLAWTAPGNIAASDNIRATATIAADGTVTTHYAKVTGFGFAIPAGDTIRGVVVRVERSVDTPVGAVIDQEVKIVKGGAIGATNKAALTTNWPATEAEATYGATDDLWGETWTPADINAATFGAAIAAKITTAWGVVAGELELIPLTARVDTITITVYHSSSTTETLVYVGDDVYSDKTAAWAAISGASTLRADASLDVVVWKGMAFFQDGVNGPYKYDGTTFAAWTSVGPKTTPPVGSFMLVDDERIYIARILNDTSAVRASTLDDFDDFPLVAKPSGDGGMVFYVGKDDGDYITAIARAHGAKWIFKRRSTYRLRGDSADTWDLTPDAVFPVGAAGHRVVANCGFALCWTDGLRAYALDGAGQLNAEFGKQIEPLLKSVPLAEWANRCSVFWNGYWILWYTVDHCVVYDFRTQSWRGPWYTLPARHAIVDRDEDAVWVASGVAGEVWKLTGITDDGVAIPWVSESKAYSVEEGLTSRARSLRVVADGTAGVITAEVVGTGNVGQQSPLVTTRTLAFVGNQILTLAEPLTGPEAPNHQVRLSGSGLVGRVYEYAFRAEKVRRTGG